MNIKINITRIIFLIISIFIYNFIFIDRLKHPSFGDLEWKIDWFFLIVGFVIHMLFIYFWSNEIINTKVNNYWNFFLILICVWYSIYMIFLAIITESTSVSLWFTWLIIITRSLQLLLWYMNNID